MVKTKVSLEAQIDASIKSNNTAQITGPVLNTILKGMSSTLYGSVFLFPADASLNAEEDKGKLLMNDGSGTAKVYQLSEALPEQNGRFVFKINDLNDLSDNSAIEIESSTSEVVFTRIMWRGGIIPETTLAELQLIKNYIDGQSTLAFLTTSIVSGKLVLQENMFSSVLIKTKDFPFGALFVDTPSRPAISPAPSAFPLGVLLGIDGGNAIISSNQVEKFLLDGSFNVNNGLFNNLTDVDFENIEDLSNAMQHIIVPSNNGKVKPINAADLNFDNDFLKTFKYHFVGIALASDDETVTVMNINQISFVVSFLVRMAQKGLIGNEI